jgi:hypothetical protein
MSTHYRCLRLRPRPRIGLQRRSFRAPLTDQRPPDLRLADKGRNAYLSAIDLGTKKTLWRSPALVANARTFVVTGDHIVAGYGFTAEPDSCTCSIAAAERCSTGSRCRARRS